MKRSDFTTAASRLYATAELCDGAIEIGGQKLTPDPTKAYVEFRLAHGFTRANRVVTAYGTTFHPGTVANSFRSLQHQVLSWGHKIKAYSRPKQDKEERDEHPRDYVLGSIVGVEFPATPALGWTVATNSAPGIRAAAVIHKQLEKVPAMLGEHLGGRHTWTVSLEVDYSLLQSGFIIGDRERAKKSVAGLLDQTTPAEFNELGLGYVTLEQAPDELLETWNFDRGCVGGKDAKGRAVPGQWEGHPVVLLKGGVNGEVHFKGVGMVRYGAERQAEIQQILATDPNALAAMEDDAVSLLTEYFRAVTENCRKLLTP